MKYPFSLIPILPIVISFIIGIILRESSLPIYIVFATTIISVIATWRFKNIWGISLMALSIGWINAELQSPKPLDQSLAVRDYTYSAIVETVIESESSRHITVNINNIGLCRITTPTMFPEIQCGDIISFTAKLESPQNKHDLPLEWDIETFLYRQGIIATAYVQPQNIDITGNSKNLYWVLQHLRHDIISLIGSSNLSDSTTEFIIATITGDDSLLSPKSRDKFAQAGLSHILALSGLHVGIIAMVITIALYPLHLMGYRKLRYAITILSLWIYACATGLSPSVTRAVIMTTIYLISLIIERRNCALNALCFAALVILLFSPMSIYSVGFQLSFCAVISILLFANKLNPINPRNRIAFNIMSLVTVSLSAMIGTGIISAFYFHTFPLYFLVGNILVILILPFLLVGGILLTILLTLGIESIWLCHILDYIHFIISYITDFCNSLPGASIDNLYFDSWLLIPYFITCALFLAALTYKKNNIWGTFITMVVIFIALIVWTKPIYPRQEIFFPRDTYYTNIIARDGSNLYLFSTAHNNELPIVIDRVKTQYRDYIGSRQVDSISIVYPHFDSKIISRRDRHLIINNDHYIIIDNNNDLRSLDVTPQYAMVCRGFTGNIIDIHNTIKPDSIILSYDLHRKRSKRYYDECVSNSIAVKSRRSY